MVPTFQCSPKYRRRISACCSGVIRAHLQGHAPDRPRLRQEPRALAAADHTARRARQRRGRRSIRRRVSGQCARRPRASGSLIPHARPIGPLMIPMIEAPFRTPAMTGSRRADGAPARGDATARRAVGVPAITGPTNGKQGAAGAAHLLAQRDVVHGVASAAATPSGRAHDSVAQLTTTASDVPWRVRGGHEGPEVQSGPSPLPCRLSLHDWRPSRRRRPWTLTDLWTRRRAHRSLQNRADAVSHERPPPSSCS